jgi:hypothetical protein
MGRDRTVNNCHFPFSQFSFFLPLHLLHFTKEVRLIKFRYRWGSGMLVSCPKLPISLSFHPISS